jgi:hypothetical protein
VGVDAEHGGVVTDLWFKISTALAALAVIFWLGLAALFQGSCFLGVGTFSGVFCLAWLLPTIAAWGLKRQGHNRLAIGAMSVPWVLSLAFFGSVLVLLS